MILKSAYKPSYISLGHELKLEPGQQQKHYCRHFQANVKSTKTYLIELSLESKCFLSIAS